MRPGRRWKGWAVGQELGWCDKDTEGQASLSHPGEEFGDQGSSRALLWQGWWCRADFHAHTRAC